MSRGSASVAYGGKLEAEPPDLRYQAEPGNEYSSFFLLPSSFFLLPMSDEIKKLDKKGLRDFGLLIGALMPLLFGLAVPLLRRHSIPWWPWAIGAVLIVLALAAPKLLNPIYHGWMRFGLTLNKIETPIVLGIVFYLIVWPMGVLKKIFGEDAMRRKLNPKMDTYRVQSKARTKVSMERPF